MRRSSGRGGSGTRITLPAVLGVMPRSDFMRAFSTTETICLSYGMIVIVRASSTATLATWLSGDSAP